MLKTRISVFSSSMIRSGCIVVLQWCACSQAMAQAQPKVSTMDHNTEVVSAQFSNDDELIITASGDGIVKLWDAKSGQLIRAFGASLGIFNKYFLATMSPDGSLIATAIGRSGKVWSTKFGDLAFPITGHLDTVKSLHFSANSKWLVTTSLDGSAKLWECQSGKRHHSLNHMFESLARKDISGVTDAKFVDKGKWLITGSNRPVKVNKLDTGKNSQTNKQRFDSTLLVWDLHSGKIVSSSFGYPFSVSSDGMSVISGSSNTTERCFRIWSASTGNIIQAVDGQGENITSCEFSNDGKWLLTASASEGTCQLWNATTLKITHHLKIGAANDLVEAHFSADGKWVATFSGDTTKVWDAVSGLLHYAIPSTRPVQFSHNGKKMIVVLGRKASQYDAHTGQPINFIENGKDVPSSRQKSVKTIR